jgi:hypothetical protein
VKTEKELLSVYSPIPARALLLMQEVVRKVRARDGVIFVQAEVSPIESFTFVTDHILSIKVADVQLGVSPCFAPAGRITSRENAGWEEGCYAWL